KENYQIASNFIAYNGLNIGEGYTEFDRYNAVKHEIAGNDNVLSTQQAVLLLSKIGVIDEGTDKLQWSVVYNMTTGRVEMFAHRNTGNIITSSLNMK
ncbi:MAG: linear amide C-N hydrolase, partial [Spirochaetota bacterium]